MNFLIISHAAHHKIEGQYYAYAPYVREMNLWLKHVDQVEIVAPVSSVLDKTINLAYEHHNILISEVPAFSLVNYKEKLLSLIKLPKILWTIFKAMKQADHIHLRCPGNIGLLGCMVQILFPKTPKTAKYAGNWDPKARQPWSYKLQKWLLSNTYLTRNMQVLVYGKWPDQSRNIKSFFTASYFEHEKAPVTTIDYTQSIHFCFVGSLVKGKQPLKALEFVEKLQKKGKNAILHIYGEGPERKAIENQIQKRELEESVVLHGNQPKGKIKQALQDYHFLILPSQSEGWPKVVAEAMFWGCIPMVTPISCLPWMLDYGKRGMLMDDNNLDETAERLIHLLKTPKQLEDMASRAVAWSRQYTLDKFEEELRKVLA
ncbi:glycosyltransferase family 4 protein [Psychroflexus sp. CAK57W]|uniref:glycosyltransferase family 4 protein n=1 Tax=Psychroflexus curvus TaxID=2873595 RepID=UPI001CCF4904|nr:glycosyltransferase [Psychroflexus curvus]MBZ9787822.1 glycosyltransferase family 4 protein [Psychroflexus curvus]